MAYRFDPYDQSIVIDGWEAGIGDSPHKGLSNLQCVNIASIPGEASVNFSTATSFPVTPPTRGTVVSVATNRVTFSATIPAAENNMAITFQGVASYTGLTVGSCYWIGAISNGTTTALIYSDAALLTQVTITGSGNAPFTFFNVSQPKYFTYGGAASNTVFRYFMVDTNGNVWSNKYTTTPSGFWIFMGNSVRNQGTTSTGNGITGSGSGGHNTNDQSEGNGIVYYSGSGATGYVFVFSSSSVDYMSDVSANTWTYGWNPSAGTVGATTAQFTMGLGETTSTSHQAILAPDARVYFCDWYNIRKFFQTSTTAFNPLDSTTYTYTNFTLLPYNDFSQCLAPLGTKMLIGGQRNAVYVWDTVSNLVNYPILLPENNTANIVTVDSNAYLFTGNRGRIYITNGAQANLFKKVPDHISTTVEPYFTWGGATYNKNQLYFGVYGVTNARLTNANYGGVWAVHLDTGALRLVMKLSYGTYDGYATAIIPNAVTDPGGAGLFIGWVSAVVNNVPTASAGGLDTTSSTPYTGSQAVIETDLIPVGTYDKPRDLTRIQYLLTTPLVAGESINIYSRTNFNNAYNATAVLSDSTAANYANSAPIDFRNAQWIQFKIVLNSTATNPSYVRLKEIRLTGLTSPTLATVQTI